MALQVRREVEAKSVLCIVLYGVVYGVLWCDACCVVMRCGSPAAFYSLFYSMN